MAEYQALARKYRPHILADLAGQDVLVRTITNAIESDRIHHAFLFTGTRGVGKTTTARIIALSLNCTGENGQNTKPVVNPCLKCSNCVQILAGNHPDVVEFDAASKTGIDSMREVIDSCMYPPISARNKIYIIDEVHMLSKAAFNALLKTLEEPPRNIKFIFATTEIKKVPITIVSRCQKFVLRNFSLDALFVHLFEIAAKEGYEAEPEAIKMLAEMAAGSARDGLSLLDQSIALSTDKTITLQQVMGMLAISENSVICGLFKAIVEQNRVEIQNSMTEIASSVSDLTGIVGDLLEIIAIATKFVTYQKIEGENAIISQLISDLKDKLTAQLLFRLWHIAMQTLDDLKTLNNITVLDIMIAKMLFAVQLPLPSEILQKLQTEAQETAEKLFSNK